MRTVLSALAAAALFASSVAAVDAQTEPAKDKSPTKVYAYQKKLPTPKSPDINANPTSETTPTRFAKPAPLASEAWWQEMWLNPGGD